CCSRTSTLPSLRGESPPSLLPCREGFTYPRREQPVAPAIGSEVPPAPILTPVLGDRPDGAITCVKQLPIRTDSAGDRVEKPMWGRLATGWQPARRLVTAAGPLRRRQGPIANR